MKTEFAVRDSFAMMRVMKLVLTWLVVILPLSWGVKKSVEKSMPLFGVNAPAVAK